MELGPRQKTLVGALRSGKYHQTKGVMKSGNAFCCLGVACDISGVGSWNEYDRYLSDRYVLPQEVKRYFRFRTETGSTLAALNDSGVPFEVLADKIEADPEGFFDKAV